MAVMQRLPFILWFPMYCAVHSYCFRESATVYSLLISFYYGAKKEDKIHILYRKAFFVTIAVSLILCIAVVLFLNPLTALFGISDAIFEGAKTAILITTVSFPFLGITRVTSAIFMRQKKHEIPLFWSTWSPAYYCP